MEALGLACILLITSPMLNGNMLHASTRMDSKALGVCQVDGGSCSRHIGSCNTSCDPLCYICIYCRA